MPEGSEDSTCIIQTADRKEVTPLPPIERIRSSKLPADEFERRLMELKTKYESGDTASVAFTDTCFRRFLIGRKDCVKDAFDALRKFAHWRIETKADLVTFESGGIFLKNRVSFIHEYDKHGRPVVYSNPDNPGESNFLLSSRMSLESERMPVCT